MEMTEIVVWRTRGMTAIYLQAPLGWLTMTGVTRNNLSPRTALDLDHTNMLFPPTWLVGSGSHSWVPRYLQHCGYVLCCGCSCPWPKRKTKAMSASLKSFPMCGSHHVTLFIVVSFIGVIY
jgi:hypothetical protein